MPEKLPMGSVVTGWLLFAMIALLAWLIANYPEQPTQRAFANGCKAIAEGERDTDKNHRESANRMTPVDHGETAPSNAQTKQEEEQRADERRLAEYTCQLAVYTAQLATFTSWLVGVTVVLALVGIWQGIQLSRHAGHAERAIKISENAAKRQLRAYVFTPSGEIDWRDRPERRERDPAFVTIIVRNYGSTPAYNVRIYTIFDAVDKEVIFPEFGDFRNADNIGVIAPRAQYRYIKKSEEGIRHRIFGREAHGTVTVWGEIRYKDAFGDDQWSRYCLNPVDQEMFKLKPAEIGNDGS